MRHLFLLISLLCSVAQANDRNHHYHNDPFGIPTGGGGRITLPVSFGFDGEIEFALGEETMENDILGMHWMVMPTVRVGVQSRERFIMLREASPNQARLGLGSSSAEGFLFIKNSGWDVGLGPTITAMPTDINWGGFVNAGILPFYGRSRTTIKHVKNKYREEEHEALPMPTTPELADEYKVGDRLIYTSNGGIMFSAGVGVSVAGTLGARFLAEGRWKTTIKKVDEDTFDLTYSKVKIGALSLGLGNISTSIGIEAFKASDKAFNFRFKLVNSHAWQAFGHAMKGDLTMAQDAAANGSENIVHRFSSSFTSVGALFNFRTGLPFVFSWNYTRGVQKTTGVEELIAEGKEVKSALSIHLRERRTSGMLSNNVQNKFNTIALIQEREDNDGVKYKIYASTVKWFYDKDKVKLSTLRGKINDALEEMGLTGIEDYVQDSRSKTNYMRAEITLQFSMDFLKKVIARGSLRGLDVCRSEDDDCLDAFEEVEEVSKDIHRRKMMVDKESSDLLLDLTQELMESRELITDLMRELDAEDEVIAMFKIQGEEIPRTEIKLDFAPLED